MRFLVAPQFTSKLKALSLADTQTVGDFLRAVENAEGQSELLKISNLSIALVADNIYTAKFGSTRLYFTMGKDAGGEYVLLLDVTAQYPETQSRGLFAAKDPRLTAALNPSLNTAISPIFNSGLNPMFNSSINPTFNTSLNPTFNTSINPIFNTSLNPVFNASINPTFNTSLNPRFNSFINPTLNRAFGGPYLYAVNLKQEGYLVRANDDVSLVFDLAGNHIGELVRATDNIRVQFDANNQWNGYVVRANDDVSLRFEVGGTWRGVVV
jgi:hypothetical protein